MKRWCVPSINSIAKVFNACCSPNLVTINSVCLLPTFISRCRLFSKRLLKKAKGIIVITQSLKDYYIKKGADPDRVLVSPDGVDFNYFNLTLTKEEARKKLNLPINKKIVVYTGHLYKWKGVDVLADAARLLPKDTIIYFVGGLEKLRQEFIRKYEDLIKAGKIVSIKHQPQEFIPVWLKAADLLVLPNTAKDNISKYYTSPLKLFEYMVSRRPILAADLPSLRDILNDNNSVFFKPDEAKDLAMKVVKIINQEIETKEKIKNAFEQVKKYSWDNRARSILNFINSRTFTNGK